MAREQQPDDEHANSRTTGGESPDHATGSADRLEGRQAGRSGVPFWAMLALTLLILLVLVLIGRATGVI